MAIVARKLVLIDFATICGNFPVVLSGPQARTVKELKDHAPNENVFQHKVGGTFTFADIDPGDHHTATFTPLGSGYKGTFTLGPVNQSTNAFAWNFKVSDGQLDHLQAGQTLTQTYKVAVNDGHGHKATQTVTVKLVGTNDAPVYTTPPPVETIDAPFFGSADEIVQGNIKFKDVDTLDTHTVSFVPQGGGAGYIGALTLGPINQASDTFHWNFTVNDTALLNLFFSNKFTPQTQLYDVTINDGHGGTAKQTITVHLLPPSEGSIGGAASAMAHPDFIL